MKTSFRSVTFGAALLAMGTVTAQETVPVPANPGKEMSTPRPAPATKPRVMDGWRSLQIGLLIKEVGLTQEQVGKCKDINARYQKEYQSLDQNMPLEERKAHVKKLMTSREVEVKAVLTPEQTEKYNNLRTPSGELRGPSRTGPISKEPAKMTTTPVAPRKPAPAEKKAD